MVALLVAQKLSKKVFANCATKLKPYLTKGVAENYVIDKEIPKSTFCYGIPIPKEDDSDLVIEHNTEKVQGNNLMGYSTSLLLGSKQEFKLNELLEVLQHLEVNDMVENKEDLDEMVFKKLLELKPNGLVETVEENFEFLLVLQVVQLVDFIFSKEFDSKHPTLKSILFGLKIEVKLPKALQLYYFVASKFVWLQHYKTQGQVFTKLGR
ncbi:hypothetical protein SLEP1_g31466 [Rubroshorea leprosula]|uniref:Uncharacterized protein n=1 Tax=Rubroshorea leprosula TaxID=152421 RepID=A0AAV5K3F9_9ROSI|nr:hypothetical protein SLEP1_g31466 [Rubroshorea leprosula]